MVFWDYWGTRNNEYLHLKLLGTRNKGNSLEHGPRSRLVDEVLLNLSQAAKEGDLTHELQDHFLKARRSDIMIEVGRAAHEIYDQAKEDLNLVPEVWEATFFSKLDDVNREARTQAYQNAKAMLLQKYNLNDYYAMTKKKRTEIENSHPVLQKRRMLLDALPKINLDDYKKNAQ